MRSHVMNFPITHNPGKQIESEEIELTSSSSSSSSSSRHLTRKRIQKYSLAAQSMKSLRLESKVNKSSSWAAEAEPATTEEQMAFCLMMLSRDKWRREEEDHKKPSKLKTRAKYKCETCNKVFKSYQALGGHRASHKKMKSYGGGSATVTDLEIENINAAGADRKIHGCPFCSRVFSSGQALGGHKRSHVTGAAAVAGSLALPHPRRSASASVDTLIDLNLPAPAEDDEISQISDAEFVNGVRR